jgi:hypothetical protein
MCVRVPPRVEQNQDGFRRTGLLDKVVPTLAHPDPEVRLSAAEALVNLSVSVKNQEVPQARPLLSAAAARMLLTLCPTDDRQGQCSAPGNPGAEVRRRSFPTTEPSPSSQPVPVRYVRRSAFLISTFTFWSD